MANTQLIVLFVLHSKATIWWCYFFRKHEETECKRWMILNDIRLPGGRWYWHEFKKPETVLNWEGKFWVKDGRVLAHLESVIVIQAQFHIIGRPPFQLSAARSRKLVCAYFSRWLEYWWRHVPAFLSRRLSTKHKENLLYWKWERILKEVATSEICKKSAFHFFRRLSPKSKIWEQRMPWP